MVSKLITLVFFCLFLIGCNNYDKKNEITISVKVVDSYTKHPRINDTVTVRQAKWNIPLRKYVEIGQYVTDSLGMVTLKINKEKRYSFETDGPNFAFGSDEYGEGELKNNQIIVIKVIPPDKKQFKIE
ncbi:hypothetical protein SAMN05421841_3792 [Chryseobacterium wanjuense]|jgi:hypothetical protein|uniref:Uncharacterized protein n=1 Tax=Chryseobacterium wanjuense TaxID=356305 RepID=A0A1I0S1E2_9FLAO|nr:hypothetical protein [Chryseobacterium wanjuense]SEW48321.1 hypothetical protein SAMN05421841_3792 [Chryseobacterium wanjuense]